MLNSIFKNTMVDMNWTEIKYYAEKKAIVLLPLGVIEEHGPHMCLGTDIYLAHTQCLLIREWLNSEGEKSIIAPPFYWGINKATGGFSGSFTSRKETVKAIIYDILSSLSNFGFRNVYGINAHGDPEHCKTLIEAFKEAIVNIPINACYTIPQGALKRYELNGNEPYVLPILPQSIDTCASKYADIHAGSTETAYMHKYHSELVDIEKAKTLIPIELDNDNLTRWIDGNETINLSPDGYLGAPADYIVVDAETNYNDTAKRIAEAILGRII